MTVQNPSVIDFVAHDPETDSVLLVMVEAREWGASGALLPDLQAKLNTYLDYAVGGQLATDYPEMAGKPVHIELRASFPLGPREHDFLRVVVSKHLESAGIPFRFKLIDEHAGAGS
jgi:hypothetical protein